VSAKPRLGQVGYNKENDVVEGIVIMLRGENPSEVIARLKDRIERAEWRRVAG
jgi:cobalt-zinc-cadmium resistance protein CzcA